MSAVTVRAVAAEDREAWAVLYRGYRDFYARPHDPSVYDTVWGWLMDPAHGTRALVASLDGQLVGLGHFRGFARPIDGGRGLYLDDLFTLPEARGTGAASAILQRLAEIARDEGASLVRWITAEDNTTARSLYDRRAQQTPWVTYDMAPAAE
ncbi:GNAT family N-acetyltransferase [Leucobacter insecticola]|uniref:GNAT family N-acetyltransferase n=1 Tax=Leucobacter insecticola TaxID=2714934 RepID=A0A6G8FGH6_9MICO|nr:GNAT family N-acetyltransferase [Leucobacter insecticola]QIM15501.1 GNAT family N-acetyltransferase [Leucobacter insecticola]